MRVQPCVAALSMLVATSMVVAATPRQIENRKLAWADFQGAPETSRPFDAYTYWSVHYSYDAPVQEGTGFRVHVQVWNQLDDRSWVKPYVAKDPKKEELLNHEQGHYTMGVLCALEFKQAASGRLFGPQYHSEIRSLFDQILGKYVALEKTYDAETRHMLDRVAQQAWDRRLALMVRERWAAR